MKAKILIMIFAFIGTLNAQSRFIEGGFVNCDSIATDENNSAIDLSDLDITKIELVSYQFTFLRYQEKRYDPKSNTLVLFKGFGKRSKIKHREIKEFKTQKLSIDYNSLEEQVSIENKDNIKVILNTIKNGYVSNYWAAGGALCYQPRNAVVFKNANNEIEYIIELCFECSNYVLVGQGINPRNKKIGICKTTIEYIRSLFKSNGISYGIDRIN